MHIVVKYVKKSAQNTAFSMFERNMHEYVKFSIKRPEKLNLDPVKFCPKYVEFFKLFIVKYIL